ncbi:hypothetical protein ECZU26_10830 [Escherichia coli]|nr:hypothetical protein ECZU26_10830 [Escherichia coli]
MTWSRYGQLLTVTDCSGYVTRYDHDRFGQMTAVHREEGLSQYARIRQPWTVNCGERHAGP